MNEPMKPASDDDFQRDLDAVSRAYRAAPATAGADGPPAAIDEAIRAAARRAVSAGPRPVSATWLKRWSRPLSAAALLVLTVSIGFVALDERPEPAPLTTAAIREKVVAPAELTVPAAARADAAQVSPTGTAKQAMALEYNSAPALSAPVEAEPMALQKRRWSDATASADKLAPARESAEAAAARSDTTPASISPTLPAAPAAPAKNVARRMVPPPAVEIATPSTVVASAPAPAAPPVNAPPAVAAAPVPSPQTESTFARAEVGGLARDRAAPAAVGSVAGTKTELPAKVAEPPTAAKLAAAPAGSAVNTLIEAKINAPAPPPSAAAAAGAPIAVAAERVTPTGSRLAAEKEKKDSETPEAWIKRILELKMQLKLREADEELAKFRKRYPDYSLPPALNPLKGGR